MRTTKRAFVTVAAIGLAAGASAQDGTLCWYWDLIDTAGNVGFVDVNESARLTLWVGFDPPNHGFAQGGPYDIVGDAEWAAGSIAHFDNLLFFVTGFGTVGAGNSITNVESFQLAEFFNPDYNADNPIPLYFIEWTPGRYAGQFVTITNGSPDGFIYTNDLGSSVPYAGDPSCGSFTFQVVPAPGSVALVGIAAFATLRRRRSDAGQPGVAGPAERTGARPYPAPLLPLP